MLQGVLFVNVWHRSLTTQAQSLWPRFQQSTTRHWPTLTVEFVASVCQTRSHWLAGSKSPGGRPMRTEITAAGPWQNRSSAECWKLYPVDCEMKVVPETSPRNLVIYILDIYISILRRRKWQRKWCEHEIDFVNCNDHPLSALTNILYLSLPKGNVMMLILMLLVILQ